MTESDEDCKRYIFFYFELDRKSLRQHVEYFNSFIGNKAIDQRFGAQYKKNICLLNFVANFLVFLLFQLFDQSKYTTEDSVTKNGNADGFYRLRQKHYAQSLKLALNQSCFNTTVM